jgi:cyclopropane fatty-acyl-phospholipid synthase-like methyltransferase
MIRAKSQEWSRMSLSAMNDHRAELRQTYDKYAQERENSQREQWKMEERLIFFDLLQSESKHDLLELGAGNGLDSLFFQSKGLNVTCVDLSPAMVELCQQKGLNARVMEMGRLQFPGESFDAVYSMNSLLHLRKRELPALLSRVSALLRHAGLVYIGVFGGVDSEQVWEDDYYTPPRFFSFFTDEGLQQQVSQVFELVYFKPVYHDPASPHHFQSMIARKSRSSANPR